jgi:preprotein translocase subunit SecE
VARSTRQQRRQRRAQQHPALAGGPPARPPVRPVETGGDEPSRGREPKPERQEDVRPGTPGIRFFRESYAELKKVEWPNQQQLISGTAVVIMACLITGTFLWLNDQLWKYVVQHLLLH